VDETARRGGKQLAEFMGIPYSTLNEKYLPDMKRDGVVLEWVDGRPRRKSLVWFPSVVIRYLSMLQRGKYAAKHPEKK